MPTKFITLVSIVVLSLLARFADAAEEWSRLDQLRPAIVVAGK